MGCCQNKKVTRRDKNFLVDCSAKVKDLYDSYFRVVAYLQASQFFAKSSDELTNTIKRYANGNFEFDKEDLSASAVDAVHKLHPLEYKTHMVTKEWLLDACLRHQTFVEEVELNLLEFDVCFYIYVHFVYLCSCNSDEVIVPSKEADFVWQAHMQDNERYRSDMMNRLGWVLKYNDNIT
jgi:hypothetical protein